MGGLRGKRDDETGEDEGEFARRGPTRGRREAARKTWREAVRRARRLNPGGHALAAQCRQSSARNRLGAERGSAQSLVGIDDGHRAGGQRESIRFFLRASARSRLRRCTRTPKRLAIAPTHCGMVRSGVAAFNAST